MGINGHISIHRRILEWEWYTSVNHYKLFTHLLLIAKWKNTEWRNITIARGQCLTSIRELSNDTGLSIQNVRTVLKDLLLTQELTQHLTQSKAVKKTIITIIKYDYFQGSNTVSNTTSNKRLTRVQHDLPCNSIESLTKNPPNKDNKYNNIYIVQIENLYAKYYPRKEGKSKGVKKIAKDIKSEKDLLLLEKAIKNYSTSVSKREKKYIKIFSSFASEWKDYVDINNHIENRLPDYIPKRQNGDEVILRED